MSGCVAFLHHALQETAAPTGALLEVVGEARGVARLAWRPPPPRSSGSRPRARPGQSRGAPVSERPGGAPAHRGAARGEPNPPSAPSVGRSIRKTVPTGRGRRWRSGHGTPEGLHRTARTHDPRVMSSYELRHFRLKDRRSPSWARASRPSERIHQAVPDGAKEAEFTVRASAAPGSTASPRIRLHGGSPGEVIQRSDGRGNRLRLPAVG